MKATPLWAQLEIGTLSLSDVITRTSAISSVLDELRYKGNVTHDHFDLSCFRLHLSRDGGMEDLSSSHSCKLEEEEDEDGSIAHLAPSAISPSTMTSCIPSILSYPTSK